MGYMALVLFWMAFEYIHLNWQLSWPWLTLGNVFASHPKWVQWYEYTGTSGGTLWVLLANVLLFEMLKAITNNRFTVKKTIWSAVVIVLPLLFSLPLIPAEKPNTQTANVVIVQPNIDPYTKFASTETANEIHKLVSLSENAIDSNTRLVLWPETAMSGFEVFDSQLSSFRPYQPAFAFAANHPNITLLSGIEIFKSYTQAQATPTARQYGDNTYYDDFNAAVTFKKGQPQQYYYKSRFVPGVEKLPAFLKFMAPVFEKFGGTTGGYGSQPESSVLQQPGQPYIAAPVICYESIYGEYVGTYVQKGANILTIITNDGWWGNTPGHKQLLHYARLRAIETRRWIARSANTGISAVINERGDILETRPWAREATLKYNIPTLTGITFYVKYGDILSKAALIIAALFVGWHLISIFKSRFMATK